MKGEVWIDGKAIGRIEAIELPRLRRPPDLPQEITIELRFKPDWVGIWHAMARSL